MPLFLGMDTGTSGTKAVVADETGKILATFTEEYPLSTPHPQWAEQHPDTDWWRAAQVPRQDAVEDATPATGRRRQAYPTARPQARGSRPAADSPDVPLLPLTQAMPPVASRHRGTPPLVWGS